MLGKQRGTQTMTNIDATKDFVWPFDHVWPKLPMIVRQSSSSSLLACPSDVVLVSIISSSQANCIWSSTCWNRESKRIFSSCAKRKTCHSCSHQFAHWTDTFRTEDVPVIVIHGCVLEAVLFFFNQQQRLSPCWKTWNHYHSTKKVKRKLTWKNQDVFIILHSDRRWDSLTP